MTAPATTFPPTEQPTTRRATLEDLCQAPDDRKAELVNGLILFMSPIGYAPGYAGDEIYASLRAST